MVRFFKAVDFIEQHLASPLTVKHVADVSSYSLFHFCRMFKALVGESVMDYVRRRRLSMAAVRLIAEDVRIIDVALDCQFESHEAFTRAFKKMFHIGPKAYRKLKQPMKLNYRERFDWETLDHLRKGITMEPVLKIKAGFMVVGMSEDFNDETKHNIPVLWEAFSQKRQTIPHQKGSASFGVCIAPNINEGDFSYIAGVEVDSLDEVPEGMVGREIPKQTYAVFTHKLTSKNLHQDIQKTIKYIWGTWLPNSEYEYTGTPDFEYYDQRFDPIQMKGQFDIFVPIRKK